MREEFPATSPVKLLFRKRFHALLSNGDLTRCIVRQGEDIHVIGERSDGSLVALRRTHGGPCTWQVPERPMYMLLGMGAKRISIEVDYDPITFTD